MKYMLLIYADEQAWTEPEREHCYGESTELCHTLKSSGQYFAASPLQPVSAATSVRVRQGKRLVTDGPFAEKREQLGGYFLVEAGTLTRRLALQDGFRGRAKARLRSGRWWRYRACQRHRPLTF
jgi:hypothetical protein